MGKKCEELEETIKRQSEIIDLKESVIKSQDEHINLLESQITTLKHQLEVIKNNYQDLVLKNDALKEKNNFLFKFSTR